MYQDQRQKFHGMSWCHLMVKFSEACPHGGKHTALRGRTRVLLWWRTNFLWWNMTIGVYKCIIMKGNEKYSL